MLILQVILSAIAWFRGWKWYALTPLTVGIILTLLFKFIFINPSNGMTMKLVASISSVVINLVLLLLCFFKKPTKSQKDKDLSDMLKGVDLNREKEHAREERDSLKNESNKQRDNIYQSSNQVSLRSKTDKIVILRGEEKQNVSQKQSLIPFLLILAFIVLCTFLLIKYQQVKNQNILLKDDLNIEMENRSYVKYMEDSLEALTNQMKNLENELSNLKEVARQQSNLQSSSKTPKAKTSQVEIINRKGFGIELRHLEWEEDIFSDDGTKVLKRFSVLNITEECFNSIGFDFEVFDKDGVLINTGFCFFDINTGGLGYVCKGEAKYAYTDLGKASYSNGQRIRMIIKSLSYKE